MIFFVGNDGTIVKGLPSPVYQGAANSNTVYLIAPFAENTSVTVAFKLPNGVVTAPAAMASQGAIAGVTDAATGQTYAGWTYDLPNSITSLYGTVTAQFFFYSAQAGVITATSGTSFQVGRGVAAVLPDTPEEDVYEQILSNIAALQTDVSNGYYAARAIYAWNAAMTYGANEITYYPVGTYGALVKSVVASNTNHEPYTDGVLNSTYWAEVLNFDEALTTAEEAKDAAAASAAEAAESAKSAKQSETQVNAAVILVQGMVQEVENTGKQIQDLAEELAEIVDDSSESAAAAAQSAQDAAVSAELARKYAELGIQPNTDYTSVDDLPVPGSTKFIYLIPATDGSGQDVYDEYMWVPSKQAYEQIGSTRIDLSNYAQKNGSYPDMSVGNATKATQDASGNVITETYATKADVDASVVDLGTLVVGSNTISSALVQAALDEKCVFIKFALENTILYLPKATTASSAEAATFGFANYDSSLVSYMVGISGTTAIVSYNEIDIATEAQVNAKYTKPSTGIPESDLASAVQTSLNKADTALQSVPLATASAVGGVKPVAKTDDMTQSVGVDANGALFTAPSGGGSIEYMTDDEVDALFASTPSIPSFADATWEQIAQVAEAGTASDYFAVGDEKTIALSTDEQITLVILGFNHDDLSDGSGKAGITIGMKNLLATQYSINATATNAGGWDESEMRTSTMPTLLSQLPSDLQSVVKQVNKKATAGSQSTSITTSADKLWLLAEVEVDGTTSAGYADEGERYEYWKTVKNGTVAADRIKYSSNGSGSAGLWWLRSPRVSNSMFFLGITSSGGVFDYSANVTRGVSFGFCV